MNYDKNAILIASALPFQKHAKSLVNNRLKSLWPHMQVPLLLLCMSMSHFMSKMRLANFLSKIRLGRLSAAQQVLCSVSNRPSSIFFATLSWEVGYFLHAEFLDKIRLGRL